MKVKIIAGLFKGKEGYLIGKSEYGRLMIHLLTGDIINVENRNCIVY